MANKKLMDEDLRQANKSTSTLKTQAFKLANGTRYKATAADGEMGKFAGNNPAYPAGYMNPNLRPQNVAGNQVVPLPSGPSFTANTNTRVKLGNGQIVSMPANTTMNFTQQPTMNVFQSAADVLMGRNTPGSMFYDNSGNSGVAVSRGNATMSTPGKGGNVNPMLAKNGFAGMQTGAGAVVATNNTPRNRYNPLGFQPGGNGVFPDITAGYGTGSFIPKGMIMSDRVAVNQFPQVTSGSGFQTRSPFPPVIKDKTYQTPSSPYTGTAGYWAGNNQTGASSYSATSYMAPNQQGNTTQKPPSNEITSENYSQWVDYWNWQARNPQAARAQAQAQAAAQGKPDPFAPYVMTRDQIWQMKANQRRKQMEKNAEGNPYAPAGVVSYAPNPYTGTGDYYSTILNTGSG